MSTLKERREALNVTLKKLRVERGAAVDEAAERNKARQTARRQVRAALTAGPATVPALASASGLPTEEVLWHVAAMRKYGDILEVGMDGDYCTYELAARAGRETGGGDA
jgi:hypothetical protein